MRVSALDAGVVNATAGGLAADEPGGLAVWAAQVSKVSELKATSWNRWSKPVKFIVEPCAGTRKPTCTCGLCTCSLLYL